MSLLKRPQHKPLLMTGMGSFAVANAWHWLSTHPGGRIPEDLSDGVFGLLYGVAIACILLSFRSRGRCSRDQAA
ncbi:MAG TPA: hypothetical protein VKF32_08920 [Thermoanaerobaculia bacterium]|nr:hypothetical protein [Thermoanaerobaculia bacterium]